MTEHYSHTRSWIARLELIAVVEVRSKIQTDHRRRWGETKETTSSAPEPDDIHVIYSVGQQLVW